MIIKSLDHLKLISNKIADNVSEKDCILLIGEIGVGKTTFVRFFINYLESKNSIKSSDVLSPTFNIVYDYDVKDIKILHYDLYRLKNYKDIAQLGMFETSTDHIKIVEWPELIEPKPKDRIDISLKYSKLELARQVEINGFGKWKDYNFNEISGSTLIDISGNGNNGNVSNATWVESGVQLQSNDNCDSDDNNEFVCSDNDNDSCDDCSSGSYNIDNDGADNDSDGACDLTDPDDDNDGCLDADDDMPFEWDDDYDGDGCAHDVPR